MKTDNGSGGARVAADNEADQKLWRGLGLADGTLLVVGSMVGSGIFLSLSP